VFSAISCAKSVLLSLARERLGRVASRRKLHSALCRNRIGRKERKAANIKYLDANPLPFSAFALVECPDVIPMAFDH